jgi:hypothetical protein
MSNSLAPVTKSKPVIITFWVSIFFNAYNALDAVGNAEFLLQKIGLSEDAAKFLGSSRGIDFMVAVSLLALVLAVAYQVKRLQAFEQKEPKVKADGEQKQPEVKANEKEPCPDKWLHDIAEEQRKAIHRYIKVERRLIQHHDLLRESPYIDFMFIVSNHSVYKISLGELGGTIGYAGRPLDKAPMWGGDSLNQLPYGRGEFRIKQPLTKEDAIYILNNGGSFGFDELKIKVTGNPKVETQNLIPPDPIHCQELLKHYPKLEIEIQDSRLIGLWHLDEPEKPFSDGALIGSVVTLQVHFENPRAQAVDVRGFKLDTNPYVARITPAEAGAIYPFPHSRNEKERLENLNQCPIHAEQRQPFDGWLQFQLKGVKPDELQGATPTLLIVDSSGEKHWRGTPALKRL